MVNDDVVEGERGAAAAPAAGPVGLVPQLRRGVQAPGPGQLVQPVTGRLS